ncbi:enolase-like domain-containing protein [Haladaptatus cibarius]|uniref:enolase n=1 Tax=Haladaptatus cibarius TaxID=453847 RepID=UPI000679B1B6|nr:enolase [Haladaptatus cibarius]
MALYHEVKDLPLSIETCEYETHERETSSDFTRVTTEIVLRGAGETGRGEDVTYDADDQYALADAEFDLSGEYTLDEFSAAVADRDLFPEGPSRDDFRHYRQWGFESAALDLALRQADTDLPTVLGRTPSPVTFVMSTRLGDPPSAERVTRWLDIDSSLAFKLDPTPEWSADLISKLADTEKVRIVDLKSQYENTEVGQSADPELYRRIRDGLPNAIIEDPAYTDETEPILDAAQERISWDVPITGVESVKSLPFKPDWLNIKPSRFGSVESLFDTLEHCDRRGIQLYGGGQFELSIARGQIQLLASLFYPDSPNDVAPRGYNDPEPTEGLPSSPLDAPSVEGFRRE